MPEVQGRDQDSGRSQDTDGDWLRPPTLASDWLALAPSSPMYSLAHERPYLGPSGVS